MAHGLSLVQNAFFTDTETFKGRGLSLNKLEFRRNFKAALMEIASRFEVLKLLIKMSHRQVSLESFPSLTLAPILLTVDKRVRERGKHFRCLLKSSFLPLFHLVLLKECGRRFNC